MVPGANGRKNTQPDLVLQVRCLKPLPWPFTPSSTPSAVQTLVQVADEVAEAGRIVEGAKDSITMHAVRFCLCLDSNHSLLPSCPTLHSVCYHSMMQR